MPVNQYIDHDGINIAAGRAIRHSHIHKFGAVPSLSINTTGSIWDISDTLYPWSALDTPAVVNIERNDVADEGHVITVQGLDENYNFQEEEITISGTDTLGTKTFRRVNRAFCTDTISGSTNTGNIDIEAGAAGGTTVARITAGKGQTLMSVYTIPKNKTGYLMKGTMTCQASADASGNMFVRYAGQDTFRIGHSFEVSGSGGQYMYEFAIPIQIPSMSDIDVRASVRSNNARVTAAFDLILVDK